MEIAAENAVRNGVSDRFRLLRADLLTAAPEELGRFDAILSNPPYIRSDVVDTLSEEVRHEPRMALDGGADGLDFYRAIIKNYSSALAQRGYLCFEFGMGQENAVCSLLMRGGYEILELKKDTAEITRAVLAQKREEN